jgi:hypothetical protein
MMMIRDTIFGLGKPPTQNHGSLVPHPVNEGQNNGRMIVLANSIKKYLLSLTRARHLSGILIATFAISTAIPALAEPKQSDKDVMISQAAAGETGSGYLGVSATGQLYIELDKPKISATANYLRIRIININSMGPLDLGFTFASLSGGFNWTGYKSLPKGLGASSLQIQIGLTNPQTFTFRDKCLSDNPLGAVDTAFIVMYPDVSIPYKGGVTHNFSAISLKRENIEKILATWWLLNEVYKASKRAGITLEHTNVCFDPRNPDGSKGRTNYIAIHPDIADKEEIIINEIQIGEGDQGDFYTAIHEYAHSIMTESYDGNDWVNCPTSGPATGARGAKVDFYVQPSCAWAEGWANHFVLMMWDSLRALQWKDLGYIESINTNFEFYHDATRYKSQRKTSIGRVTAALWDMYDKPNDCATNGETAIGKKSSISVADFGASGFCDDNYGRRVPMSVFFKAIEDGLSRNLQSYVVKLRNRIGETIKPTEISTETNNRIFNIMKYNYLRAIP